MSISVSNAAQIRSTRVPEGRSQHPLIAGQVFYTLPETLLQIVEGEVGVSKFDTNLWKLENDLAAITANHDSLVGFAAGQKICFTHLCEFRLDDAALNFIRTTTQSSNPERVVAELKDQSSRASRAIRAYCGWLMTTPTFLEEHALLHATITSLIAGAAWPHRIPATLPGSYAAIGLQADKQSEHSAAVHALNEFCSRWRLSDLVGPLLPVPIGIQAPAMLPQLAVQHATASGYGMIAIPDTMPIPSESQLRTMVEGAIRMRRPVQLQEWTDLIDPSNEGKKTLDRYARVFPLQHYYRLFRSRHPQAFQGRVEQFRLAFGKFMHVSEDTIRRDLELIKQRLGDKWWDRFPIPPIGPG